MNTIKIKFSKASNLQAFHNGEKIINIKSPGEHVFVIENLKKANEFCIVNHDGPCYIDWITMYDIGKQKLVYLGKCIENDKTYQSQLVVPGASWILSYQYPVFLWLTKNLYPGSWLYEA